MWCIKEYRKRSHLQTAPQKLINSGRCRSTPGVHQLWRILKVSQKAQVAGHYIEVTPKRNWEKLSMIQYDKEWAEVVLYYFSPLFVVLYYTLLNKVT